MRSLRTLLFVAGASLALAGCEGGVGPAGPAGSDGMTGVNGADCTATDNMDGTYDLDCGGTVITVSDGEGCTATDNMDGTYTLDCGGNIVVVSDGANGAGLVSENCTTCHSPTNEASPAKVHLVKEYDFPAPDIVYTAEIADAQILGSGELEVTFSIIDNHGYYIDIGMWQDAGPLSAYDVRFYLAKLDPTNNNWYRVIYERGTAGTSFVNNMDGTYTFVSSVDVSAGYTNATYPALDAAYDDTATYRAGLAFGGHGGPASSPTFDFRPSDGETDPTVIATRNIVSTATCVKCHGNDFHGHGGDRETLENCVMCHNPTTTQLSNDIVNNNTSILGGVDEADSTDMAVMIHNIHNGTDDYWVYRTRAGGNWYNWGDNPDGWERSTHTMTFPQPSYTCVACHESDTSVMSDGLNWQTEPTAWDCSDSCHTDLDIRTAGTTHAVGQQVNDNNCAMCHTPADIMGKHSTANTDIISAADLALDTPEFTVALSLVDSAGADIPAGTDIATLMSPPSVKIVISDGSGPIDHTTISTFNHAYLFVYGPRARAVPVLTTAAAAGGMGYYANNDLTDDTAATITAGSIVYQLTDPAGLEAGTYAAYVDVREVEGDETNGFQAPSNAKMNFQVGTTTVDKQVAGNCMSCHGDTIMHGGKFNSHRHDMTFDAEACAACHDYVNGNATANAYEWFGAVPISKRVHAVHAAAILIDPDYTIGHAPADPTHEWAHISYPATLNDCFGTCHLPANSTDAWQENANQLACMGCHDTPGASDHFLLMGGEPVPPPAMP